MEKQYEVSETVRNFRLRRNPKTGKTEVLLLKKKYPNGKIRNEFPGGKLNDSDAEYLRFEKKTKKEKQEKRKSVLIKETLEETGYDINAEVKDRQREFIADEIRNTKKDIDQVLSDVMDKGIAYLGQYSYDYKKRDGKYFSFKNDGKLEFDSGRVHFFATWQNDSEKEINYKDSDDNIIGYEWLPLEHFQEILDDPEYFEGEAREFSRNSDISKIENNILKRVSAVCLRNFEGEKQRVTMKEILEEDTIESIGYDGDKINMFDFQKPELLKGPMRKSFIEKYWGKIEPEWKLLTPNQLAEYRKDNNIKDGEPREMKDILKSLEINKIIVENFNSDMESAVSYCKEHLNMSFPVKLEQEFSFKNKEEIMNFLGKLVQEFPLTDKEEIMSLPEKFTQKSLLEKTEELTNFLVKLAQKFPLKDMDDLTSFLMKLVQKLPLKNKQETLSFPAKLTQKFPLKDATEIIEFSRGFGNKEWFKDCLSLFKVARAYRHFREEAPYYFEGEKSLENHAKDFSDQFEKQIIGDGLKSVGKENRDIKISGAFTANAKAEYRVVDKLVTKPSLEFKHVPDIFRGMVVCEQKEFNDVGRSLKSKYKKVGIELRDKKVTNKGNGMKSTRYLVGEYPVTDIIKGKRVKFTVPFEMQIIDEEGKINSKAEEGNHEFYALKNNFGPRDTKLTGGAKQELVEGELMDLSKKPELQSRKNLEISRKKLGRKIMRGDTAKGTVVDKTYEKLEKEYKKVSFLMPDGKYIAYQNVIRLWGTGIADLDQENQMIKKLNNRTGIALTKDQWGIFFKNPLEFSNKTIYDLEEKGRKKENVEKRVNKFRNVVRTIRGIKI